MTYVMSDIHGMYEKYMKMLELIEFSGDDDLFVVGDVVDRGREPAAILLDMMNRPNVCPITGNHEIMTLKVLDIMFNGEPADSSVPIDVLMEDWFRNGGAYTLDSFSRLPDPKRLDVFDYLSEFTPYEAVDIGDKTFIMVHAGFDNFSPERKLSGYSVNELVWHSPDADFRYFDDENIYVISGHTPTLAINGKASIIHRNGNIFIDCGAFCEDGRLACLCLDTMEEFYV